MDTNSIGLIIFVGLLHFGSPENKYNDHGIVLTARPYDYGSDHRQLVTMPVTPRELPNYNSRTFPGLRFEDIYMKLHACDVDYDRNMLYMYDYDYRELVVGSNFNTSVIKEEMNFTREFYGLSQEYVKIAVDWVAHNVYMTDTVMGSIIMQPGRQDLDQTLHTIVIHTGLDLPRGIAVDPLAGILFWSDFSKNSKIERSTLIGELREVIVHSSLYLPDAVTADHLNERIYFTNKDTIETVAYDGSDRRSLVTEPKAYFFDIAIYGDVVISTDIDSPYNVYFYDINTGEEAVPKEDSSDEAFFGVCMYHKDVQPSPPEDRCSTAGCQDICVDEPYKTTATCLCRLGWQLNPDGKTCKEKEGQYYRAIILNNGSHLCLLDIRAMSSHHTYKPDCFYEHPDKTEAMTYMEVNMRSREVYFSTETAIYSVSIERANVNASAVKLTETLPSNSGSGRVTGLSYDYTTQHLYWSESDPDGIFVMNPDSPATEFVQLVPDPNNIKNSGTGSSPRGILVTPHERQLIWFSGNVSSEDVILEHTYLTENAPVEPIELSELPTDIYLSNPTHVYNNVKEQRLFMLDIGWGEVIVITYNGTYKTDFNIYSDVKDFALYNDYLLLISHDSDGNSVLSSADLGFGAPLQFVEDGIIEDIGAVVSIKVLDANVLQPLYPNPCTDLNGKAGGCEQLCFPMGDQAVCRCGTGFELNSDGKTCDTTTVNDNFILVSDNTHSNIHLIDMATPNMIHGVKAPNERMLTFVFYDYLNQRVILGSEDSDQIWSVSLDGTDATMIQDVGSSFGSPMAVALEPTNGYLYYSSVNYWSMYIEDWSSIRMVDPNGLDTLIYDGGTYIYDIVLHAGAGFMFWTNFASYEQGVYRANMDGSDATNIAGSDQGIIRPFGLAIDYEENMLYWTDEQTKKIYRSDLDGNDLVELYEETGTVADIRLVGDYLYYAVKEKIYITRMHKHDQTDIMKFGPTGGVGAFHSLDVYVSSEVFKIPKSSACLDNNGDCSTFCFPHSTKGSVCGCEGTYDLLVDNKTCENYGCPATVTYASVDPDCLRTPGNQCKFTCFADLKPKEKNKPLTCLSDLTWDDDSPCKEPKYQNKYGDHGIVLTARGFNLDDFKQVVAIPTEPREIPNYQSRTFPGMRFEDIKKKLHACDIDYNMNMLYLYDYQYRSILVADNFNTSVIKEAMNFTTEVHSISQEYVKIAVDWVSHNVYWTDSVMGAIMMRPGGQNIDPNLILRVYHQDLSVPRGIAVDPLSGYLFWTDLQRGNRIQRSSLTGKNVVHLITTALYVSDAIAADHASQKIFFINRYDIESAGYDGNNRIRLVKNSQAFFFDISVFQDVIMATDISKYYLFFYDTETGEEVVPKEGSSTEGYFGVCTYHSSIQPPSATDYCEESECQDICVNEPNAVKATCLCRMGYELNEDGKTCTEKAGQYHRAIIVTNGTDICFLDIRILSDHHDHKVDCFYKHSGTDLIQFMDVQMQNREVFFATAYTIYRVPMDRNNANAVKLATTPNNRNKGEITGLSYDWVNNHLYWSEASPDGVFLINPDDPEEFLEVVGGESSFVPRGVLVVPHQSTVYWLATNSTGNNSYIASGDLGVTASVEKVIATDLPLLQPTRILHDVKHEQLYVLDLGWSAVIQCSYNGTFTESFSLTGVAKDFALYKDYILIMEHNADGSTILYSGDAGYGAPLAVIAQGTVEDIGTVISMKIVDYEVLQPPYPSPCGEREGKYGECEQICIPIEDKAECMCDTGFTLNKDDNKTCDSAPVMDDFIVVTDAIHSKIFQIPLSNYGELHGIKLHNKDSISGILYNYMTNQIVWGSETSSQIWGTNIDGSNVTFITDLDELYGVPSAIALDRTSGNLFVTAQSYYGYGFITVVSPSGGKTTVYNRGHLLSDIVLHPEKGYMFWVDYGDPAMVARAGMDGSDITMIAEDADASYPLGLAIDYEVGRIYWTDALLHKIYSSDFDGNDPVVFHQDTGYMVDIKLFGDYLYYTGLDKMHITKIYKNDKTNVTVIGPDAGVGNFGNLDIYSSKTVANIPVNVICSSNNGDCSHFCLPDGKGGRTCACEVGVELLSDGTNCANVPRCLPTVTGGMIDGACHRLPGQRCNFTCDVNFKPKSGVKNLLCQGPSDEELTWNNESPCEEILCPANIPNGDLPMNCSMKVGESCNNFSCNQGYEINEAVTSLNCTEDGTWSTQPGMLCKEKCPPFTMDREMATLVSSCKRDPNEICSYKCIQNYKSTSETPTIRCLSGSRWNRITTSLCEEILCPDYIPDGRIDRSSCTYKVDSKCSFTCDKGFTANRLVSKLHCLSTGNWSQITDETPLCLAPTPKPEAPSDKVVIGMGVAIGILFLIILVILVCIVLYRMGRMPGKKATGSSGSAFENPRYEESSFDVPPGARAEANKDFSYATLEEDKLELTDESWRKAQARAPDNVYDNSPATIQSSTINPRF